MDLAIDLKIDLSEVLTKKGVVGKRADDAISAALEVLVEEYVAQSPGNHGDLKGEIKVKKNGSLDYIIHSGAGEESKDSSGRTYPENLYTGTGKLRGSPDTGFTTGRVRAGEVAYGIGGVRPNKASDRTVKAKKDEYLKKVSYLLDLA